MRKTKIVCTIGPASESPEILEKLIEAGMNVARLNFSHGSHEEHAGRIHLIREVAQKLNKPVGILLDTKGPEIRTHNMKNGELHLSAGQVIDISMTEVEGTETSFSVTYERLIEDVEQNSIILLDDGLIQLRVLATDMEKGLIHTIVENAGVLKIKRVLTYQVFLYNYQVSQKKTHKIFYLVSNKVSILLPLHSFVVQKMSLKFVNCLNKMVVVIFISSQN